MHLATVILLVSIGTAVALVFLARFGGRLCLLWREPVLKRPVLIIESDDWGPGETTEDLAAILNTLGRHRNRDGKHPVMTMAVVLAVPDRVRIRSGGFESYHRIKLDEPRFEEIRTLLENGVERGVFALQLHGMEHCWPPSLLASARNDGDVRSWFDEDGFPDAQGLPPVMQTRWADVTTLPSSRLPTDEVTAAVTEEVKAFQEVFGEAPRVVVPPTFIWTDEVERVWARAGVSVIVTPGARYEKRDSEGRPSGASEILVNGQRGNSGCRYVVRDVYFEPSWGHQPTRVLEAMARKTREGRPTLVETHRFNFTGDFEHRKRSLDALDRLLEGVLVLHPDVCFLPTAALVEAMEHRDSDLVDCTFLPRLRAWFWRLCAVAASRWGRAP